MWLLAYDISLKFIFSSALIFKVLIWVWFWDQNIGLLNFSQWGPVGGQDLFQYMPQFLVITITIFEHPALEPAEYTVNSTLPSVFSEVSIDMLPSCMISYLISLILHMHICDICSDIIDLWYHKFLILYEQNYDIIDDMIS